MQTKLRDLALEKKLLKIHSKLAIKKKENYLPLILHAYLNGDHIVHLNLFCADKQSTAFKNQPFS